MTVAVHWLLLVLSAVVLCIECVVQDGSGYALVPSGYLTLSF